MIRSLEIHNFKCFEKQKFEFAPLTLLSGLNGMGKSSVLQSLLLLRQSYQQGLLRSEGLSLKGDLVQLGIAQDVFYFVIPRNEESGGHRRDSSFLGMTSPRRPTYKIVFWSKR